MKLHYNNRKYKEIITLGCSDKCLQNFREDDLTRTEMNCMLNCFNKYYRFLAHSNNVYNTITNSEEVMSKMGIKDGSEEVNPKVLSMAQ